MNYLKMPRIPQPDDINILDIKQSCRVATTANITLSGEQTIDGISVVSGDRVLVKDQSNSANNGIYICSTGDWQRATDFDTGTVSSGAFTFIEEGTQYENNGFVLSTPDPVTVGTTDLSFVQFTGTGEITAGTGLTKTGNELDVIGGDGILANADEIEVDVDNSTLELSASNGSGQVRIKDNGVTLSKLSSIANMRVIGNTSGSSATPSAVSILDEDTLSSNSNTALATQQSIKAYVDTSNTMGDGFVIEDGDGTEVTITENKEVKIIGGTGIVTNWTDTSHGTDGDPYDLTITCDLEGTELSSSGESGGTKFLREDGDGTCSWQLLDIPNGQAKYDTATYFTVPKGNPDTDPNEYGGALDDYLKPSIVVQERGQKVLIQASITGEWSGGSRYNAGVIICRENPDESIHLIRPDNSGGSDSRLRVLAQFLISHPTDSSSSSTTMEAAHVLCVDDEITAAGTYSYYPVLVSSNSTTNTFVLNRVQNSSNLVHCERARSTISLQLLSS